MMEQQPEPKRCRIFRTLTAVTAAAALVSASVHTSEPVQLICETLAAAAALAIICISDRLSGVRFSWSPILLAASFIFRIGEPSSLQVTLLTAPLLAASFPFVLLSIETSRADFAADAAALVTAAAFICPPSAWLLIPLAILIAAKSGSPLKLLAGESAGILMVSITASCIIILAGGAGAVPERIGAFCADIQNTGRAALQFNGWESLYRGAFILSFLAAVTLLFRHRTRLGLLEARRMETAAVFLFSLIPLRIIYGDSMGRPATMLITILSAFLICDILRVTKYNKVLTMLLLACLIFNLAAIISAFIPEMNDVFAIFAV